MPNGLCVLVISKCDFVQNKIGTLFFHTCYFTLQQTIIFKSKMPIDLKPQNDELIRNRRFLLDEMIQNLP